MKGVLSLSQELQDSLERYVMKENFIKKMFLLKNVFGDEF